MKRINQLKKKVRKYQTGGTTPTDPPATAEQKPAAATETRTFNNIVPIVDPKTGVVNWDLYNKSLSAYPQGYSNTDPSKKNPNEVNTVHYYVGQTITPGIKTKQEIFNKQLNL